MPIKVRAFSPCSGISRLLLVCLVAVGLVAAACSKGGGSGSPPAEGAGRGGGRGAGRGGGGPVPVVTTHAVQKPVPVTIPAVGTAEPLATVQIRAQVTGQLSAIHFTEGQDVKAGHAALHSGRASVPGGPATGAGHARPGHCSSQERRIAACPLRGSLQQGAHRARSVRSAGSDVDRSRVDAGRGPGADRERAAQPAICANRGADLRTHGRPQRPPGRPRARQRHDTARHHQSARADLRVVLGARPLSP